MKTKNPPISFGMGLHMHQPPDNLRVLIEHNEWEAQQIIHCYARAAEYALKYPEYPFHVDFSGILLEQFLDPYIIDAYRKFVDIPKMLDAYKRAKNIEIIGMGFFHPIFPLIPQEDWDEQLAMGMDIFQKVFGRKPKGFWPSEMAFCMDMVPYLKKAGYEYVIVDHVHVVPEKKTDTPDIFKPYIAEFDGAQIVIVPRNRDVSNAQESGMNPTWFIPEVTRQIAACPSNEKDRLMVTWSDGENGGWFRQMDANAGFFGYFWESLITEIKRGAATIKPVTITRYIADHPPTEKATVKTGAWNVASTSGYDFSQWHGSDSQKKAVETLCATSKRWWELKNQKGKRAISEEQLARARRLVLDAETSCYLFWGDAWIPKLYEKTTAANALMK